MSVSNSRRDATAGRPDSLRDLDRLIGEWWEEAQRSKPNWFAGYERPGLFSEITGREARLFLDGLRTDPPLYEVVDGYALWTPLRPGANRHTFHLFEKSTRSYRRETVAHIAAVTELVLERGWPRTLVIVEPPGRRDVKAGAVDVLLADPAGGDGYYLAVEAKGLPKDLTALVKGMIRCGGSDATHNPVSHKKCKALLEFRPAFSWGVALDARGLYRISYLESQFTLEPEPSDSLTLPVMRERIAFDGNSGTEPPQFRQ